MEAVYKRYIFTSLVIFSLVALFISSAVLADEATECSSAGGKYFANALSGPYAGNSCETYCQAIEGASRLRSVSGTNCCCSVSSTYGASRSRAATPNAASFVNGDKPTFENPLPAGEDVPVIVGNVIKTVLGIIGSIALVIFLYGGIQWMVSMGDEQKINKGRDTMIWAGLGLIVIFGSYTLVQLLLKTVLGS